MPHDTQPATRSWAWILISVQVALALVTVIALAACGSAATTPEPAPRPLARELIVYDWSDDLPQSVLDAFAREVGVTVIFKTYESQEAAIESMRAGQVYDVVVMSNDLVPALVADHLLAEIDFRNVPNFKNISANFLDLAYDAGNKHSVPYSWGTIGLIVRSDLVQVMPRRWADLWDTRYAGKVAVWALQRDLIAIALKSLGYSANSESPFELEAALQRLLTLKKNAVLWDLNEALAPALTEGQAVLAYGWSYDAISGQEVNRAVRYILPDEGALLWGDNYVIPANSPNPYTAEVFVNFLLRPEISAQIVNETFYATANEAARPFIDPDVLTDPIVYPTTESLRNAEITLPLSPEGQKLYDDIWARFMAAGQ